MSARGARLRMWVSVGAFVVAPFGVSSAAVVLRLHSSSTPPSGKALSPAALAAMYAPELRLASDERLVPIDQAAYVQNTTLWTIGFRYRKIPYPYRTTEDTTAPTLATLPTTDPARCPGSLPRCNYFLSVRGLTTHSGIGAYKKLQDRILATTRPTVYWHYVAHPQALQYWFFYDFNYFANYHEGDWEQISIALNEGSPTELGYSSHKNGQRLAWNALGANHDLVGTHPVVYVAVGSHANYFAPGAYPVSECHDLCDDHADGAGTPLTPADYELARLHGRPVYTGDYGPGNFALPGLVRISTGVNVADPASRDVWTNPTAWIKAADPATIPPAAAQAAVKTTEGAP